MPEFQIYKGEYSVRIENEMLKQELAEQDAEIARLRELAGLAAIAAPVREQNTRQHGESFKTANSTVRITPAGGANAATPAIAPVVASRRLISPAQAALNAQREEQRARVLAAANGGAAQEQDEDEQEYQQQAAPAPTTLNFSMLTGATNGAGQAQGRLVGGGGPRPVARQGRQAPRNVQGAPIARQSARASAPGAPKFLTAAELAAQQEASQKAASQASATLDDDSAMRFAQIELK